MTDTYFNSKKDIVYFIVVWATVIFVLLSIVFGFSFTLFNLVWGVIGLLATGLLLWIWFGTGYRIENEHINIQNGPFKWKVTIKDINRISKRKSLLATPALSVDRLVLHYGKYNEILLSPKNEGEFVAILLTKNPSIQLNEIVSQNQSK